MGIGRLSALAAIVLLSSCATTSGKSAGEKRAAIADMEREVLAALYERKPDVQAQIGSAAGHGVFSNANVYLLFASVGGGYGVVERRGGRRTYMRMGELGVGVGAGVKDYRIVLVFHTSDALDYFIERGWSFGGQADAAAKASDKGGAVGAESIINNITVYQMTESGLALQATIKGTKFWRDDALN